MEEKKQIKTGLWNKISKNGTAYADGKIKIGEKEYKITLFLNKQKLKDTSPDFQLILEEKEKSKNEAFKKIDISEISDDDIAF